MRTRMQFFPGTRTQFLTHTVFIRTSYSTSWQWQPKRTRPELAVFRARILSMYYDRKGGDYYITGISIFMMMTSIAVFGDYGDDRASREIYGGNRRGSIFEKDVEKIDGGCSLWFSFF